MESTDHPPPAPGDEDPRVSRADLDAIRGWLDGSTENHLMILETGFAVAYGCESQVDVEVDTPGALMGGTRFLHRAFAATPAPWAGRPYAYVYAIAMDNAGPVLASLQVERAWLEDVPRDDWTALIEVLFGHNG